MSLETITQTEIKDPEYRKVAEAVLAIAGGGKEQGQDQETIRVMLHSFAQAAAHRDNMPVCEGPRPRY